MKTNPSALNLSGDRSRSAVVDLSPEDRLRRQAGVVLCHVDGKHMLVPAMTNAVELDCLFLLNETGVFVWEQIDGRRRVHMLADLVARAYGISSEAALGDLVAFLALLLDHNLVEPVDSQWY